MSTGYDVVMVCGGARCEHRTEELIDALGAVVRVASMSMLVRTECLATCRGTGGCGVLMQRVDERMRPAGRACRPVSARTPELRREVARWLLSDEPAGPD